MSAPLQRTVFSTSRAAEFLERRALQSQTGQPAHRFGDVVVKELLDNALDAAETAGVAPQITVSFAVSGNLQHITVADNGPGMPAEVIERILDFGTTTSDKAAYRSPTRGAQGNAWKTVLGIPHALGVAEPVVIEACGIRHEVAVSIDPAGDVAIRHDSQESQRIAGTAVTVPLPISQDVDLCDWLQKFAAVNPHASLILLDEFGDPAAAGIYNATAQDGWRKPLPSDPTSPHWYDDAALKRLVFAHIRAARGGGRDLPIGEFIRSFAGLSSPTKAKQVKAAVPGIERLSDFAEDVDAVALLLKAMQAEAKIPKPAVLGQVPEEHYRRWIDATFGVRRFWFRRRRIDLDGVPWLLEVAVAETDRPGLVAYGVNYSASFGDPFGQTRLTADDVTTTGVASFLWRTGAHDGNRAVVVHVACPAPEFTDKGKVALTVPGAVADAFAAALGEATKTLHREHKQAERDARKAEKQAERDRRRTEREKVTLKDAVFAVMPEAIAFVSGNGKYPFPTRGLMYRVRRQIQRLTDAEMKSSYFSQDLVVEWERLHGRIPGHYRDPRGELTEPHTGKVVRLGTLEVAEYVLPPHLYNKILYVEKEGFNPIFKVARLAEKYDMAIASGKGQPVEAVRDLFTRAGEGDYTLFVLHDADHAGYTIARAMAEATDRMPGYSVDVIDLGLSVADAVSMELPTEAYTRRVELPWWMPERLDETETQWFGGRQVTPKQWACTRVELNELSGPQLIDYIEAGLRRHGATAKLIPPAEIIGKEADEHRRKLLKEKARTVLDGLLDIEKLVDAVAGTLIGEFDVDLSTDDLATALDRDPHVSWRDAVEGLIGKRIDDDVIRQRAHALYASRGVTKKGP